MAKQIAGLCFLEGTFDDLTFYKMDGQYYVRVKSSLSSERVKTSPEFKWTMIYARLMARASKIGAAVYNGLPPGWRQFWMYRSFTGEAFTLLKENPYTDEQVTQLLSKCYVEYWEQLKVTDPANPIWQPKPTKIRKRRKYSIESLLRKKDKKGKPLWRDPKAMERRLQEVEKKRTWAAEVSANEAWCRQQTAQEAQQAALHHTVTYKEPETPNPKPETISPWHVTNDGLLQTTDKHIIPLYAQERCNSS